MLNASNEHAQVDAPSSLTAIAREANIRRALAIARSDLGMDAAWISEFVAGDQVFRFVDAAPEGRGPAEGSSEPLAASYCARVLDGRLPSVIANALAEPAARDLEVTRSLDIGAYVGVPVTAGDGRVTGMLCAISARPDPGLDDADLAVFELVASLVASLAEETSDAERVQLQSAVLGLVEGTGRRVVLQPIVDLGTGTAVGVEALTRFTDPPHRPDRWFALAEEVGLRVPLELATARSALDQTQGRAGYVSINLSPASIASGALGTLLDGHDPGRVVVEITEHAVVGDYARINAALQPHRAAGMRLAIDDAGAGYASFRHILEMRPDLIKADLSLVRGVDSDAVRQALTASLLVFARSAGARVVAEGVETQRELDTLARLGVSLVQGYLLGRPCDDPALAGYCAPSPHVVFGAAADIRAVVADAIRAEQSFEGRVRRLLDVVIGVTGLETSYLTVVRPGDQLEHRYVRNVGRIQLPEGFTLPWAESLCSSMRDHGRVWTNYAGYDLADRPIAGEFGLASFLSLDINDAQGALIGTLCAGSSESIFISDTTIAKLEFIAYVLGSELDRLGDP